MEYLAAGLPIVAFETTETRRVAGEAARYAPKGDVATMARLIDELLDEKEEREEMTYAGQRRAKESIAWEHQAARYVPAIKALVDTRKAGGRD
jgi:glycosyltransferase involved in cell wall biosynthesis